MEILGAEVDRSAKEYTNLQKEKEKETNRLIKDLKKLTDTNGRLKNLVRIPRQLSKFLSWKFLPGNPFWQPLLWECLLQPFHEAPDSGEGESDGQYRSPCDGIPKTEGIFTCISAISTLRYISTPCRSNCKSWGREASRWKQRPTAVRKRRRPFAINYCHWRRNITTSRWN